MKRKIRTVCCVGAAIGFVGSLVAFNLQCPAKPPPTERVAIIGGASNIVADCSDTVLIGVSGLHVTNVTRTLIVGGDDREYRVLMTEREADVVFGLLKRLK